MNYIFTDEICDHCLENHECAVTITGFTTCMECVSKYNLTLLDDGEV